MKKRNTMDDIKVKCFLPNGQDFKETDIPISDFLFKVHPEQLSEQQQKVQRVLKKLYELNDREPPLFHSFPKWRPMPLTVDCTGLPLDSRCSAHYVQSKNRVEFRHATLEGSEDFLLVTLAHELKHAEQYTQECAGIENKGDNFSFHQVRYLEEAQAFAFENYVSYLAFGENAKEAHFQRGAINIIQQHMKGKKIPEYAKVEEELIRYVLPFLYRMDCYKGDFDKHRLISKKDKGLSYVPSFFNFQNPEAFLSIIQQEMPREAMYQDQRALQIVQDICPQLVTAIQMGDLEKLIQLKEKHKLENIPSMALSRFVEKEFSKSPACEWIPEEVLRNSDKILQILLDLKVKGENVIDQDCISHLFQAVYRWDVDEALKTYWKQHPTDTRFLGLSNILAQSNGVQRVHELFFKYKELLPSLKDLTYKENGKTKVISSVRVGRNATPGCCPIAFLLKGAGSTCNLLGKNTSPKELARYQAIINALCQNPAFRRDYIKELGIFQALINRLSKNQNFNREYTKLFKETGSRANSSRQPIKELGRI